MNRKMTKNKTVFTIRINEEYLKETCNAQDDIDEEVYESTHLLIVKK